MGVSRPTYTRIYEKARRTIATALVEGKVIFIEVGIITSIIIGIDVILVGRLW